MKLITITDEQGKIILEKNLLSLPLREECIIKKSVEIFNDDEPCIIHKTYAMKKIYFELDDYFNSVLQGENELIIKVLPDHIKKFLDINEKKFMVHIHS